MIVWLATSALAFDHAHTAYAEAIRGLVSDAGVDYAALAGRDRKAKLDAYVAEVATADLAAMTDAQKLAFYIDAYDALTLELVLESGPPASIRDLDGGEVWDTRRFVVGGESLTLNQLEHERIRELGDGRVHAVVSCAAKGCPPLPPEPILAATLDAQLDEAARRWARTNAFAIDGRTVRLSRVFEWYAADFAEEGKGDLANVDGAAEDALWFLSRYVDDATRRELLSGSLTATWTDYDWALNDSTPAGGLRPSSNSTPAGGLRPSSK
jgi:hypothetical protein